MTFNHIELTGADQSEVLRRARTLKRAMQKRFGKGSFSTQEAIDGVIDGLIEWNHDKAIYQ